MMAIKNRILLVSLLLLFIVESKAQYKPFVFGLRVAPSIGWIKPDADYYESDGIHPGFSWGFTGEFYFTENYAFVTGFNLLYLNGGLKYPDARAISADTLATVGETQRYYKLQYLEIPLIFKMKTTLSERWKVSAKIGLGNGFLLRARAEDTFTYPGGQAEEEHSISDEMNKVREALIIGGGAEFTIKGSSLLLLEVNFNNGFTDMLTGTNVVHPDVDQKASSSFVELGVGIIF
jgi:hypothetical protein